VAAAGLQWPLPEDVTDEILEGRLSARWVHRASGGGVEPNWARNWRGI